MPNGFRATALAALVLVSLVAVAAAPAGATHDDGDCSFPVEETDLTGEEVTIEEPPEEIVVLDAASAQTAWEIGAEDRVIGMPVREYTEYLEGSEDRTDVLTADGMGVDVETVIELEPDLVIAPNYTPEETIQQLRDAGLTVFQLEFEESFEEIYAKTELLGHFLDECESAERVAEETRTEVETIREAVEDEEPPRVLYYSFEFTAGSETFIGDIIETAGGQNVAAEAGIEGFEQISAEVILDTDPEWIIRDTPDALDTDQEPFPETTAVEQDQVLTVDENLINQAAPRVVEPLRELAEAFHPEAFEAETPEPTPTPEPEPEPEPEDQVGPGIGVAVVALVAALVARRLR